MQQHNINSLDKTYREKIFTEIEAPFRGILRGKFFVEPSSKEQKKAALDKLIALIQRVETELQPNEITKLFGYIGLNSLNNSRTKDYILSSYFRFRLGGMHEYNKVNSEKIPSFLPVTQESKVFKDLYHEMLNALRPLQAISEGLLAKYHNLFSSAVRSLSQKEIELFKDFITGDYDEKQQKTKSKQQDSREVETKQMTEKVRDAMAQNPKLLVDTLKNSIITDATRDNITIESFNTPSMQIAKNAYFFSHIPSQRRCGIYESKEEMVNGLQDVIRGNKWTEQEKIAFFLLLGGCVTHDINIENRKKNIVRVMDDRTIFGYGENSRPIIRNEAIAYLLSDFNPSEQWIMESGKAANYITQNQSLALQLAIDGRRYLKDSLGQLEYRGNTGGTSTRYRAHRKEKESYKPALDYLKKSSNFTPDFIPPTQEVSDNIEKVRSQMKHIFPEYANKVITTIQNSSIIDRYSVKATSKRPMTHKKILEVKREAASIHRFVKDNYKTNRQSSVPEAQDKIIETLEGFGKNNNISKGDILATLVLVANAPIEIRKIKFKTAGSTATTPKLKKGEIRGENKRDKNTIQEQISGILLSDTPINSTVRENVLDILIALKSLPSDQKKEIVIKLRTFFKENMREFLEYCKEEKIEAENFDDNLHVFTDLMEDEIIGLVEEVKQVVKNIKKAATNDGNIKTEHPLILNMRSKNLHSNAEANIDEMEYETVELNTPVKVESPIADRRRSHLSTASSTAREEDIINSSPHHIEEVVELASPYIEKRRITTKNDIADEVIEDEEDAYLGGLVDDFLELVTVEEVGNINNFDLHATKFDVSLSDVEELESGAALQINKSFAHFQKRRESYNSTTSLSAQGHDNTTSILGGYISSTSEDESIVDKESITPINTFSFDATSALSCLSSPYTAQNNSSKTKEGRASQAEMATLEQPQSPIIVIASRTKRLNVDPPASTTKRQITDDIKSR